MGMNFSDEKILCLFQVFATDDNVILVAHDETALCYFPYSRQIDDITVMAAEKVFRRKLSNQIIQFVPDFIDSETGYDFCDAFDPFEINDLFGGQNDLSASDYGKNVTSAFLLFQGQDFMKYFFDSFFQLCF